MKLEQKSVMNGVLMMSDGLTTSGDEVCGLTTPRLRRTPPTEGNCPALRFPEFSGEWKKSKLGQFGSLISGLTYSPDDVSENGLLVFRSSNIKNNIISYDDNVYVNILIDNNYLSLPNDILICVRNGSQRLIGKSALIPENVPLATHGAFMTVFRGESNKFVIHWFQTSMYYKQVYQNLGATINSINGSDLKKFSVIFPSLPEQTKIASFLSAVDTKIDQLTQKKALLETYKKGAMQQIFSQQIRFKADDGGEYPEWEEKKLGEVFVEVKEKVGNRNIKTYSITAGKGFVSQEEKFGKDISGAQNDKYIVLDDGFFSYNKGSSKTYKYGCIYQNKLGCKIAVPNVFISFKLKDELMIGGYFGSLFEFHYLDNFLREIISSTARMDGLLNLNKADFFNITIPVPVVQEQTKIANFLSVIDRKIDLVSQQLEQAKAFKKGLLQQMFV